MTARRLGFGVICAAWLAASGAMAQVHDAPMVQLREVPPPSEVAPQPTMVDPLTVLATRPEELKKQAYRFVQLYGATTQKLDQLARWEQPVCVTVQGLQAEANAAVKARVEEVAKALKLSVGKAGCGPNIQIMFTNQPQQLLDRVAATHADLLGYGYQRDHDKLKVVSHPIQSWYATGTGGVGGNTVGMTFMTIDTWTLGAGASSAVPPDTAGRQPHGSQMDDERNDRGATGCGDNSHFTGCLTSELQHALVVIDTSKTQDYGPGPVADYVAMLAMAQPKSLDGCNVLPSVIDLFAMNCAGRGATLNGLTRADVAYLRGLYKTDLEAKKGGQMTDIADRMADALIKNKTPDRLVARAPGEADGETPNSKSWRDRPPVLTPAYWTFMRGGLQGGWAVPR